MATTTSPPRSASRHYAESAALARRAAAEARRIRSTAAPFSAVAVSLAMHQAAAASQSERAVAQMLAEQAVDEAAEALLNVLAFTTAADVFESMSADLLDAEFERLVESLTQDAARAAESAAVVARDRVVTVRYLNPPSCSRCVVLAGRIYRWSDGFQRHPLCDCIHLATTEQAAPHLVSDPTDLIEQGLVSGLSKADMRAIADGADFNQVVNVRRARAGLMESGRVLARAGRPTPEGIYRIARTREEAVALLKRWGYLL